MAATPKVRIRIANGGEVNPSGRYVLYWMIAARRLRWNFALQRAVELCRSLDKPLLVLEALRVDHPWACDRFHAFIIDGMRAKGDALRAKGVAYYPYLEREKGAGKGLLRALAEHAALVVTDEFPCFFLPEAVRSASRQVGVRLEVVDSNGLLPLRAAARSFRRAVDFRRFLQRELRDHLDEFPRRDPLLRAIPRPAPRLSAKITRRWPRASGALLRGTRASLAAIPIDHSVFRVEIEGGEVAARQALRQFVSERLDRYGERSKDPCEELTSGLSPYLHFGQISAHEIFDAVATHEGWTPASLGREARGAREGWWGVSAASESFLDQLVTWRELGYNMCFHRKDFDRYESLPEWARETLEDHASDARRWRYGLERFDRAETHDPLWNAAQRQLVRQGRIHNYLRMLWGKKILEWSSHPEEALEIMIELNNRHALDGRDPNSYSGIFWVLGRYDRAWGPERCVFGKVRYMSSQSTARKMRVGPYVERWS